MFTFIESAAFERLRPVYLDDDEYATVIAEPVPVELETLAQQAITDCPRAALLRKD